jgi:hypothetical protein
MKKSLQLATLALSLVVGANNATAKTVDMCIGQGNSSDYLNQKKIINSEAIDAMKSTSPFKKIVIKMIREKAHLWAAFVLKEAKGNVENANQVLNTLNAEFKNSHQIRYNVFHTIGECTSEIKQQNNARNKRARRISDLQKDQ